MNNALTHKPKTDAERIKAVSARFLRRANGALSKSEARELGKLYAIDLHWRFMRTNGDKLALRPSNYMVGLWAEAGALFAPEFRLPRRHWQDFQGDHLSRHMAYYFYWLGPTSGRWWPGESPFAAKKEAAA